MMIPECILEFTTFNNGGELRFYCSSETKEAVARCFQETIASISFTDLVLEPYIIMDTGFKVKCQIIGGFQENDFDDEEEFDDDCFDEENSFGESAFDDCKQLEKTLKKVKKQFPDIRYESGGEWEQFEFISEGDGDDTAISIVGEALQRDLMFNSLADDLKLEYFGSTNDFISFLNVYQKWINESSMKALISTLEVQLNKGRVGYHESIDVLKENLNRFKHTLDTGEPYKMIEDNAGLPDGYMEDMFDLAETISGHSPAQGEIVSSVGTFKLVIEKAESGDAEAKFTAGKYFIADHIEEERERAIRWIREAAEAGIEEAVKYKDKHSELFR